jgi:hypothetical protein
MAHRIDPKMLENINPELNAGTANLDFLNLTLTAKVWLKLPKCETPNEISLDVTDEDFVNYFKNKRECTVSSPSGRHMGHYIAVARVKDGTL